ncbi:MAG: Gfo/Idh/MocA family oxidoreductase [Gammaproteobacteria bacterium]|nr:Gfo/Idh/MocA family oxidoreductase [Gammaproteobacteria bacterium]
MAAHLGLARLKRNSSLAGKLRVGIIGCGEMTRNHAAGYLHSGKYEIVAISDLSSPAMSDFDRHFSGHDDYDAEHFLDARKMLDNQQLDVVSVGVWDSGHAAMTIAAAASGVKAVLCEKPMADTLGAAADMIMVCLRNDVKLAIGHQRRWVPSYTLAKEMIAGGEIGDVRMIQVYARDGLPNYSSHQSDMFRYLLGDIECTWAMGNVERETDRWARAIPIEDKALAVFGFENGSEAIILSGLTPRHGWGASIYGSDGLIDLALSDLKIMNGNAGGWQHHRPDGTHAKYGTKNFEVIEGRLAQAHELADWVTGKVTEYRSTGESGYKALEMVHAVYESARTHTQVKIPMKTTEHPLALMIDSGHLPVRYPGRFDIRNRTLRGENVTLDTENI